MKIIVYVYIPRKDQQPKMVLYHLDLEKTRHSDHMYNILNIWTNEIYL